jgi:hypothetical protein
VAKTPTSSRLNLHRDWKHDLPLKSLWTIDFTTRDGGDTATLGSRINAVFSQYERRQPSDWQIEESLIRDQTDSSGENGYLLAQAIAFPTESYNISTGELPNSGGYLMGYISGDRLPYGSQNKLDITFLETNTDIFDYFIKPWIIANSHKGLIEDGVTDKDIKCNITVVLYTRDKKASSTGEFDYTNSRLEPRKKIVFYNAVPYSVAGDAVSYGELTYSELIKIVSFSFSHYNTVKLYDSISVPSSPTPNLVATTIPRTPSRSQLLTQPPNLAVTTIPRTPSRSQLLTQPPNTGVRDSTLPSTTTNPAAVPTTGLPLPPPAGFPLFTPDSVFPSSVPAAPIPNQPVT